MISNVNLIERPQEKITASFLTNSTEFGIHMYPNIDFMCNIEKYTDGVIIEPIAADCNIYSRVKEPFSFIGSSIFCILIGNSLFYISEDSKEYFTLKYLPDHNLNDSVTRVLDKKMKYSIGSELNTKENCVGIQILNDDNI